MPKKEIVFNKDFTKNELCKDIFQKLYIIKNSSSLTRCNLARNKQTKKTEYAKKK